MAKGCVYLVLAVLLLGPAAAAHAEPLGSLRFFAEPGPPPSTGPDPLVGGCLSSYPGDASIGTTPCGDAPGLTSAQAIALSPDGRHAYVASSTSDAVTAYARDGETGVLSAVPGGCLSQTAKTGCATANGLDGAQGVAVSPDGARVYVGSLVSDSVAVFTRDPETGVLTQAPGAAGCVSQGGVGGCTAGRGLDHVAGIAVADDSQTVYAAGRGSDAVAVLRRTTDGLEQAPGPEGCLHDAVTSDSGLTGCADARGLDGAFGLTLHGGTLYAASRVSDAIAVLHVSADGTLTQLAGADGCVAQALLADCAVTGRGLDGVTALAVAPDGAHAYAAGYASYAVTTFSRDAASGRLVAQGCFSEDRETDRCAPARGLLYAHAVAVSPDGRSVYVAGQYSSALAIFHRGPATGSLAQEQPVEGRTWSEGCISWRGHRWSRETDLSAADHSDHYCARSLGLYYPSDVVVSQDGRNVYAPAARSHSVTSFARVADGTAPPEETPADPEAGPPPPPPPAPPEPPPPAAPPPYSPPRDRTAPALRLVAPSRITIAALRRAGVRVRVVVDEPATVELRLSIAGRDATIGRAKRAVQRSARVRIRLTPRARAALRRNGRRGLWLRVGAVAADAAGNRSPVRARRVLARR
ncbi:MAG TPA: beta-propeller fold lactonase family protein [Solirubrobacteraceae bacterium]